MTTIEKRLGDLEQAIQPPEPEKGWIVVCWSAEKGYWVDPQKNNPANSLVPRKVDYRKYGEPGEGDLLLTDDEFDELERTRQVIVVKFVPMGEIAQVGGATVKAIKSPLSFDDL